MRLLFTFLVFACLSITCQAAGRKYALIVGVRSYRLEQPLPELSFTENDANKLAEVLAAGGYNVTLMTQSESASPGNEALNPLSDYIHDQLQAILDSPNLDEDDIILIALAGHGVQLDLIDGTGARQRRTPQFFFFAADADIRNLRTANEVTAKNRLINLSELYQALDGCPAGGKLLFVDACRNDPTKPSLLRSHMQTMPELPPPPGGTAAFLSCSSSQTSLEDIDLRHGVFFHHVIQALKGEADSSTKTKAADGQITLAELVEYVSTGTFDFVKTKYNGKRKQTPELKGQFRLSIPVLELGTASQQSNAMLQRIGIEFVEIPNGDLTTVNSESKQDLERDGVFLPKDYAGEDVAVGREVSVRTVPIPRFEISRYEITNGQFDAFVKATGYITDAERGDSGGEGYDKSTKAIITHRRFNWRDTGFPQSSKYPVVNVSYNDAIAFCDWFTEELQKSSVKSECYLPTLDQWEYAARAETASRYITGRFPSSLEGFANVLDTSCIEVIPLRDAELDSVFDFRDNSPFTSPVGLYKPNKWGLFDMQGNVEELCEYNFVEAVPVAEIEKPSGKEAEATPAPIVVPENAVIVPEGDLQIPVRGGHWNASPNCLRLAHSHYTSSTSCSITRGFRVVLETE